MKASYQSKEYLFNNKIEKLKPGQFIIGRKTIARETGIRETTIERILTHFESEHQIGQQKNNKFRIITICNWDQYQISGQQNEQQMDIQWTTNGHLTDTIKNIKNVKNVKKTTIGDFVSPDWLSKETWDAYVEHRKNLKKKLTDHAIKLIIKKLRQFDLSYRQIGKETGQSFQYAHRVVSGKTYPIKPKEYCQNCQDRIFGPKFYVRFWNNRKRCVIDEGCMLVLTEKGIIAESFTGIIK